MLKEGSLYVGALRKQLRTIKTEEVIAEKYPNKAHKNKVQKDIGELQAKIQHLERWIGALDIGLKRAVNLFERLSLKNVFTPVEKIIPGINTRGLPSTKKEFQLKNQGRG